ncbi:dihydrofolate reductase family protein [Caldibacillus thermolactis]|jgi:dihydrofolate reductase|uniref:Dihydrofolate reductase family protein n=1 Tax=Pallidibacillus thermolactis TaxID=251051 RepID=A0ABT2WJ47_9BACI|nr:dihydrofolate reductase family protein [Pallidibacillus thermolactis]MCU9595704.1 dihydrofolate reductase family protein [Pallidibacillus thermolactis]MCU9602722.1 dihydrofolate reductase family protein [Pallidibacillus thermolactis subsp. kokeshiiformis]MED1674518.1 dihydrofolate reductase family protein [Pallidibacillus thermolactis subsp. kokeshiiformis]
MYNNGKQRKIILDLAVSLDGFIEGPKGEIDWCIMEPDMKFTDFLNSIDTILYGRKSYDLWGNYTPKKHDSDTDKEMWRILHSKEKIVFSKTKKSDDQNTVFINDHIVEEVNKLKNRPGKDIWLYGGASLITTFIHYRLIDEYRLSIHPVVLGAGKPLFNDLNERLNFKLIDTKTFSSGVVQLIYQHK